MNTPLALVSVCMVCNREIVRGRPSGAALPKAPNQSHGICLDCTPAMCRQWNLSKEATARVMAEAEKQML